MIPVVVETNQSKKVWLKTHKNLFKLNFVKKIE